MNDSKHNKLNAGACLHIEHISVSDTALPEANSDKDNPGSYVVVMKTYSFTFSQEKKKKQKQTNKQAN